MRKIPAPLFWLTFLAVWLCGCGGPNVVSVGLKIEMVQIERAADATKSR
jgi:hypothetical protein